MTKNVFEILSGTTNIKMGSWGDSPAIFIRPMYPKDTPNHSHEFRTADHVNDLSDQEVVLVVDDKSQMAQLYMTLRQPSSEFIPGAGKRQPEDVFKVTHPPTGDVS